MLICVANIVICDDWMLSHLTIHIAAKAEKGRLRPVDPWSWGRKIPLQRGLEGVVE